VVDDIERVLRLFPDDCQSRGSEPTRWTGGLSFSGAQLWRIDAHRGPLCLRSWPAGSPSQQRLEFIQAVRWHVDQEGFHDIPVPLETRHHHGYVFHAGHLWELAPWLPGAADYYDHPSPARLEAAMIALARFHVAAATFPLPDTGPMASPGIAERSERLAALVGGGFEELRAAAGGWPELAGRASELIALAVHATPKVVPILERAATCRVDLQPCIRDVWAANILFVGDQVSGVVDFGAMRAENVAADVARLLGSMAGDDPILWQRGLAAYGKLRPLSDDERQLVTAFDRSTVLMGGLQWLTWIYLEGREFANRAGVLGRIDQFGSRLATLAQRAAG
jgi:Ser/Thr protein kinase RdoA (MazF antagonist)